MPIFDDAIFDGLTLIFDIGPPPTVPETSIISVSVQLEPTTAEVQLAKTDLALNFEGAGR